MLSSCSNGIKSKWFAWCFSFCHWYFVWLFFLQEIKKLGLAIQGALKIHSQSIQVRKCSIYWDLNWNIFLTSDLKYALDIEHKKSYTFDYGTECQQLLQITQTLLFPFKFIFKKLTTTHLQVYSVSAIVQIAYKKDLNKLMYIMPF